MPSVMGLLEERERAARQRADALQAELRAAEAVWERFAIAREAVAEVLAEPRGGEEGPLAVIAGGQPTEIVRAVPGSVVPVWQEGLTVAVLAPDYQRLMNALAGGSGRMQWRWTVGNSRWRSGWSRCQRRWRACGRR